jgi:hypothetical protein
MEQPVQERRAIEDFIGRVGGGVRREPFKALFVAFFFGAILTVFPVGRMISGLSQIVLALIRPILLVLGVVKLAEEIEERRH